MTPAALPPHATLTGRRRLILAAAVTLLAVTTMTAGSSVSAAADTPGPSVLHVGLVTRQDVAAKPGSEPDTVVEPDVAVSPKNSAIAVAASHDGRYPDGGAVGISYAWTHDGGRTWHHHYLPGLTRSTGGPKLWARASDPVVAFGPDGSVYISTLVIADSCPSAVAVSRSTNGGRTFGRPVLAHKSTSCDVSDDKNTLVVDNGAKSPHRGRLYQFWTPFLTDMFGNDDGSPQAMVYSDDHGKRWSSPVAVSAPHANTQNSTPMVTPNGTVVDAFIDFGTQAQDNEDTEFRGDRRGDARSALSSGVRPADGVSYPVIRTAISTNGGHSFHPGGIVTSDVGAGPDDIRCCLDSATADPATGRLYVAWNSADLIDVRVASSTDGRTWHSVIANRPVANRPSVNVDVAASHGTVVASYGTTNVTGSGSTFADQTIAVSTDGGSTFGTPIGVGPRSYYKYAAKAPVTFPGDYIGTSLTPNGRLYAVWCVSSAPPPAEHRAKYHQVVFGAVLQV